MTEKLTSLALILLLSGCGPAASTGGPPQNEQPAEPSPAANPPVAASPPVRTSFADIGDALAVLSAATAEGNQRQMREASDWLIARGPSAIPALRAAMNDSAADVGYRRMVCRVIGKMGPPAVPVLLEALAGEEKLVRLKAVESLGAVKPADPKTIDALIALLDDDDPAMELAAVRALGNIGGAAKAAAPRLQSILNSPEPSDTLRSAAGAALKKVNPRRQFTD